MYTFSSFLLPGLLCFYYINKTTLYFFLLMSAYMQRHLQLGMHADPITARQKRKFKAAGKRLCSMQGLVTTHIV